jgi:hypothetical protein
MARFSDLPRELLLQILGYLAGLPKYQRTLSNLCSVSRYFLPVARGRLYAAPKAHWLECNDLWTFNTLLIRTLVNNTPLRHLVRRLNLYLPRTACRPQDCYEIFKELNHDEQNELLYGLVKTGLGGAAGVLLLLTPKLEQLEISSDAPPGSIKDEPGKEILFVLLHEKTARYRPGVLCSLHTLKLCNTLPVPTWMTFLDIRTLEIGAQDFIPDFSNWPDLDMTESAHVTPIQYGYLKELGPT